MQGDECTEIYTGCITDVLLLPTHNKTLCKLCDKKVKSRKTKHWKSSDDPG